MGAAMTQLNSSASADHRILKLARTIADLDGLAKENLMYCKQGRLEFSGRI
jgi:predicted ATPase with chaperone activity